MKLILVTKINSFLNTIRIDSFHYAMFHGVGKRGDTNESPLNIINRQVRSPIELILNSYRINPVIQPLLNFIVIDDIAIQLLRRFSIQSSNVVIKGTASLEYVEGCMKHWDDPSYKDKGGTPEGLLISAAQRKNMTWDGPTLREILPCDGELLTQENPKESFSREITFKITGDEMFLCGTRQGLEKYGLLWSDGIHCMREDVFQYLEPFLHKDYFAIESVDI